MIVYRITKSIHAAEISGNGAALFPGRWNKKGTPVLYSGENKEIALLETIVHAPPMIVPDYTLLTIKIPDNSLTELKISSLPSNWFNYPAPSILADIGENWLKLGKSLALKLPSCILPSSSIIILNCVHPSFSKVKIIAQSKFYLDPRLIK